MEICKQWRETAMAYLDGELQEDQALEFQAHLEHCPTCARVFQEFRQMKEVAMRMKPPEVPEQVWAEYPRGVVNKLTRGSGWFFYLIGAMLLVAYGIYEFATGPANAIPKIGVATLILGFCLLLLSVIRSRYEECKTDRYSKEVHR